MARLPAGPPGLTDNLAALAREWAERSCVDQGLVVKISDRRTLRDVAQLLGASVGGSDPPDGGQPRGVEAVVAAPTGADRDVVEDGDAIRRLATARSSTRLERCWSSRKTRSAVVCRGYGESVDVVVSKGGGFPSPRIARSSSSATSRRSRMSFARTGASPSSATRILSPSSARGIPVSPRTASGPPAGLRIAAMRPSSASTWAREASAPRTPTGSAARFTTGAAPRVSDDSRSEIRHEGTTRRSFSEEVSHSDSSLP